MKKIRKVALSVAVASMLMAGVTTAHGGVIVNLQRQSETKVCTETGAKSGTSFDRGVIVNLTGVIVNFTGVIVNLTGVIVNLSDNSDSECGYIPTSD